MDKDFDQLIAEVKPEVEAISIDKNLHDLPTAFPFWITRSLFEDMDDDDAEIGEEGREHGIDILNIDEEKKEIIICQAKWSDSFTHKITGEDISRLVTSPDYLYGEEVVGNEEFNIRKEDFRDAISSDDKYKINLILIVAGDFTEDQQKEIDVQKQKDSIKIGTKQFDFTFEAWDKDFIYHRIFHPDTDEVTLECEKVLEYTHGDRETGFFIVKGIELNNNLKEEMYPVLFEWNPRFYLGLKSGGKKNINRHIKKTAEDEVDSKNFLEYNNGITCMCNSFEIKTDEEEKNFVTIQNLKIVNGCQTVVSLNKSAVTDNVKVLFKLYAIDQFSELKENISTFTNSQNPISPRDINSGNKEQKRIQLEIGFWELVKVLILSFNSENGSIAYNLKSTFTLSVTADLFKVTIV